MTLSMAARVLIVGLWAHADDGGGFEWKPLVLKARIFPADNIDLDPILTELEENDVIKKYDVSSKSYGAIRNFGKWQRPQKPKRFVPMPKPVREYCQSEAVCPDKENDSGNNQVRDEYNTGTQPVIDQSSNSSAEGRKVGRYEGNNSLTLRSRESDAPSTPKAEQSSQRGSRLPPDWRPTDEMRSFALSLLLNPTDVGEQFRDYWIAQPGAKGRKSDWEATWRNWCRREAERVPKRTAAHAQQPSRHDRVRDAWANVPDIPGV
ncbi:hypothetical protein FKW31_03015 [Acetobacter sp. DmW_136]|uniref:hypothetical protein n=1 Tax=Acetobacter sp. DmW_136 TaxID=2591091 RepID=UPI0012395641|nr:hypothetical protein [Acetobacter sp. DmW_136]KAA8387632.1 hypothetical protein FKW31_03015 [Acetobacter sp. DmW_136]